MSGNCFHFSFSPLSDTHIENIKVVVGVTGKQLEMKNAFLELTKTTLVTACIHDLHNTIFNLLRYLNGSVNLIKKKVLYLTQYIVQSSVYGLMHSYRGCLNEN